MSQAVIDQILSETKGLSAGVGDLSKRVKEIEGVPTLVVDLRDRMEHMERAMKLRRAAQLDGFGLPGALEAAEDSGFSILEAFRTVADPSGKKFAPGKDKIHTATREKLLQANVGPNGGYVVAPKYVDTLIPELQAKLIMGQAGATVINVSGVGQVVWPKLNSGATAYWVGEGKAITESTPAFGQVIATQKIAAVLVRTTLTWLNMTGGAGERIVRQTLLDKVLRLAELGGLRGSGSAYQPLGAANLASINSVAIGTNGGEITLNALQDIQTEVDADNIEPDGRSWIMNARLFGRIKRLRDGFSRPMVEPNVVRGQPYMLLGDPIHICNQLPSTIAKGTGTNLTEAFYARWQHAINVIWNDGLEIKLADQASDGTNHAYPQGEVWFRVFLPLDWIFEYPEAIGIIPDAKSQD